MPMLQAVLKPLAKTIADAVLPPLCFGCRAPVDHVGALCPACWRGLNFISGACCQRCGVPFDVVAGADNFDCEQCLRQPPAFSRARAPLMYDDASRGLIMQFKHGDQLHAARSFLPWLQTSGTEILARADVIIPVPLSRWRLFVRRYNQAALLAQLLARATNKIVLVDALRRIRRTPSQGGRSRAERFKNVKGAFAVPPRMAAQLQGKTVVLVDDVLTTGATASECAATLLAAGAARVDVLTVARVPLDRV